eukprot:snap_masked-scaffold_13-processed-gene-7.29-mRNA-1 protein AED:0.36 eAED:1.00 QI:0/0/0/0.5/1/1/2/0/854
MQSFGKGNALQQAGALQSSRKRGRSDSGYELESQRNFNFGSAKRGRGGRGYQRRGPKGNFLRNRRAYNYGDSHKLDMENYPKRAVKSNIIELADDFGNKKSVTAVKLLAKALVEYQEVQVDPDRSRPGENVIMEQDLDQQMKGEKVPLKEVLADTLVECVSTLPLKTSGYALLVSEISVLNVDLSQIILEKNIVNLGALLKSRVTERAEVEMRNCKIKLILKFLVELANLRILNVVKVLGVLFTLLDESKFVPSNTERVLMVLQALPFFQNYSTAALEAVTEDFKTEFNQALGEFMGVLEKCFDEVASKISEVAQDQFWLKFSVSAESLRELEAVESIVESKYFLGGMYALLVLKFKINGTLSNMDSEIQLRNIPCVYNIVSNDPEEDESLRPSVGNELVLGTPELTSLETFEEDQAMEESTEAKYFDPFSETNIQEFPVFDAAAEIFRVKIRNSIPVENEDELQGIELASIELHKSHFLDHLVTKQLVSDVITLFGTNIFHVKRCLTDLFNKQGESFRKHVVTSNLYCVVEELFFHCYKADATRKGILMQVNAQLAEKFLPKTQKRDGVQDSSKYLQVLEDYLDGFVIVLPDIKVRQDVVDVAAKVASFYLAAVFLHSNVNYTSGWSKESSNFITFSWARWDGLANSLASYNSSGGNNTSEALITRARFIEALINQVAQLSYREYFEGLLTNPLIQLLPKAEENEKEEAESELSKLVHKVVKLGEASFTHLSRALEKTERNENLSNIEQIRNLVGADDVGEDKVLALFEQQLTSKGLGLGTGWISFLVDLLLRKFNVVSQAAAIRFYFERVDSFEARDAILSLLQVEGGSEIRFEAAKHEGTFFRLLERKFQN